MPDYSKSKVYYLQNTLNNEIFYVGSTTQTFTDRLSKHKYSSIEDQQRPVYQYVAKIGGWINVEIVLHKKYNLESKEELLKMEGKLIRLFLEEGYPLQNVEIAGRTDKEYYQDNKEKMNKKNKDYHYKNKERLNAISRDYYKNNKEKMNKKNKEYYEENREEILKKQKEYNMKNKEQIAERGKRYRELNKEQLSKRSKRYREVNKEKIAERIKVKALCECGTLVTKRILNSHRKTKKHQKLMDGYTSCEEN